MKTKRKKKIETLSSQNSLQKTKSLSAFLRCTVREFSYSLVER